VVVSFKPLADDTCFLFNLPPPETPPPPLFPHPLLQKTLPAEDAREFPAEADFGPLAIFETRRLSTSLKKCPPGPKV